MKGTFFKINAECVTHFWIIVTHEVNGCYVGLNVTDEKNCPDSPCKVTPECHPAITKPSVIFYKKARRFPARDFDKLLAAHATVFEPCSSEFLARVLSAAFRADDLTASILELIDMDMEAERLHD